MLVLVLTQNNHLNSFVMMTEMIMMMVMVMMEPMFFSEMVRCLPNCHLSGWR